MSHNVLMIIIALKQTLTFIQLLFQLIVLDAKLIKLLSIFFEILILIHLSQWQYFVDDNTAAILPSLGQIFCR